MKPTSSTSRRLLRRQLAISAMPNSTAAPIPTDSIDTCIAAHPFAKQGLPLERGAHMRSLLLLASTAALIAVPAAAMQHDGHAGHAAHQSGDAIAAAVAAPTR